MKDDGNLAAEVTRLTQMLQEATRLVQTIGGPSVTVLPLPLAIEKSPALSDADTARTTRDPLPDPRLIRRIIRQRQKRSRYFDARLFADPAWDMLLDLTAARAEHRRVSTTSLCIASGVPPTTALRWINQLVEQGLFRRIGDKEDRRRAFIELSDRTANAITRYFAEMGAGMHL